MDNDRSDIDRISKLIETPKKQEMKLSGGLAPSMRSRPISKPVVP